MKKPSSHIASIAEYEIFHSGDPETTSVVSYHDKIKILMKSSYSGEEPFSHDILIADIKDYGDLCEKVNDALDLLRNQAEQEEPEYIVATYEKLTLNNLSKN